MTPKYTGRPTKRIDETLAVIRELWLMMPDMRLGQLVIVAANWDDEKFAADIFNVEDDKFLKSARKFLETMNSGT